MVQVSVNALTDRLQAAVDAQGKVAQAATDEAARQAAARDAEPSDEAETEATGDEAEQ